MDSELEQMFKHKADLMQLETYFISYV